MDEQQAILLLKKGDLAGLDMLVQQYYFRAVKTAYLILQDRDEAEDIVQTAFLHACDKIDQLASDRFGPWFLRSVVHAAIKAGKKHSRQISLNAEKGAETQSFEDLLEDRRPSPEALVEISELSQEVWQALGQLSPDQRAAVVLKYYLDKSELEISAELKHPVSTVKWRLYAARQRLRDLLHPFAPPPSDSRRRATFSDKQE